MTSSYAKSRVTGVPTPETPRPAEQIRYGSPGARAPALRRARATSVGAAPITIELSSAQVDRIVRDAGEGGNMSVLLSGLKDVRAVLDGDPGQLEDNRLSRSLLAGLLMLASLPADGTFVSNAEIARRLDMNPSTTHRYVSTLRAVGLVERDPSSRRYRLA
jgi:hypothetical protein